MTILEKDNIQLRRFSIHDQVKVARLCNNINIWNNLQDALPSPYSEQDSIEFINRSRDENPQTTFAIDFNGELAGCTGLIIQTDVHRLSAEIGYWIGEPYWRLGIATKAVELLTEYGFKQLELVRIYSRVFDFNTASQRVMEKSGFKLEGIFEKSFLKNGVIGNEYRYAKLNPKFG
jgi:ribosomal-protein-alanine N-acetyltransferase